MADKPRPPEDDFLDQSIDPDDLTRMPPPVAPKEVVAAEQAQAVQPEYTRTAADYYPLVQMTRLADAILAGPDGKVRKMHGVLLQVFGEARKDFLTFLDSLDSFANPTPTMMYRADDKGKVLPVADNVIVVDGPANDAEFVAPVINFPIDQSPVFPLTRLRAVHQQPTPVDAYNKLVEAHDTLRGFQTLAQGDVLPPVIARENELNTGDILTPPSVVPQAVLDSSLPELHTGDLITGETHIPKAVVDDSLPELNTGDEITADCITLERIPPVVDKYADLEDVTAWAILAEPTPSPSVDVVFFPSPSPDIIVTISPSFGLTVRTEANNGLTHSTLAARGAEDLTPTIDLRRVARTDFTPTPKQEAPLWVQELYARLTGVRNPLQVGVEHLLGVSDDDDTNGDPTPNPAE